MAILRAKSDAADRELDVLLMDAVLEFVDECDIQDWDNLPPTVNTDCNAIHPPPSLMAFTTKGTRRKRKELLVLVQLENCRLKSQVKMQRNLTNQLLARLPQCTNKQAEVGASV